MAKQQPVVAVFFGGTPSNYDVSAVTGRWVCQYLPRDQYRVVPVHVTPQGQWQVPLGALPTSGPVDRVVDLLLQAVPAVSPAEGIQRLLRHPLAALMTVQRGPGGDDGSLHQLGQTLQVPVVGSSAETCYRTSDKYLLSRSLEDMITTPYSRSYRHTLPTEDVMRDARHDLEAPFFFKPRQEEGSVGIKQLASYEELFTLLEQRPSTDFLLQEASQGTEINVTLVEDGRGTVHVLPPTVIQLTHAPFYDYQAKRQPGRVELHTTADLNDALSEAVVVARDVYDALGCRGYASIDLVLSEVGPTLLEVNTIPTVTPYFPFTDQLKQAQLHPARLLDEWITRTLKYGSTVTGGHDAVTTAFVSDRVPG